LFRLGEDNVRSGRDVAAFAAVNLMQDAVEAFLLAVAEVVGASVEQKTSFDEYLNRIDAKLSPQRLSFRLPLLRLNRLRVNSKHYGIKPDRAEVEELAMSSRQFLEESSSTILGVSFWSVGLIDLLDDGDTKTYLLDARQAVEQGEFAKCLIECRKVIYIHFEQHYDLAPFLEPTYELFTFGNRSPQYARNKQLIEQHVNEPCDFIHLSHDEIRAQLHDYGLSSNTFYNVLRLTPAVYRKDEESEWIVKEELHKFEKEGLADRASYVLEHTTDIALQIAEHGRSTRWAQTQIYEPPLRSPNVTIYKKADRTGPIAGVTPDGVTKVSVFAATLGLSGDARYWEVYVAGNRILQGYVHDDDIKHPETS
jgi:hypothetical protein